MRSERRTFTTRTRNHPLGGMESVLVAIVTAVVEGLLSWALWESQKPDERRSVLGLHEAPRAG